jgi:5-oxoprolinase (ATP-hydrolysing) subunit A
MTDTGWVPAIDLNADLAEHDTWTAGDVALLDHVTSASLACGFHAGNRAVMRAAAAACAERGVVIGAHISYRDREAFGRRALDVASAQLAADVVDQWETLATEAGAVGAAVAYVKPHGALYNRMAVDAEVATVVVDALSPLCGVLVSLPAGAASGPALDAGIRLVAEGFCDRGYDNRGLLVARDHDGALVDDPGAVGNQALSMAVDGGVTSVDGRWVALDVETLCVHGDHPGADRRAAAVRGALARAGVTVRPFVDPTAG